MVGRWTAAKKRRILDSRVQGTRHLADALSEGARSGPAVLMLGFRHWVLWQSRR